METQLVQKLLRFARTVVEVDSDDLDEMTDVHAELLDYFGNRVDDSGFLDEPNAEGEFESGIALMASRRNDMNRVMVAKRLLRLATHILGEEKERRAREWTPVRRDVNVHRRNDEMWKSLSSFAPSLSKEVRKRLSDLLNRDGYELRPNDLVRVWSKYLTYIDELNNNNKYHYYAIYSFTGPEGETLYVAANCSGRIGIIERAYDLTKKFLRGPARSENAAMGAINGHMRSKLSKGYQPAPMIRG